MTNLPSLFSALIRGDRPDREDARLIRLRTCLLCNRTTPHEWASFGLGRRVYLRCCICGAMRMEQKP